MGQKVFLGYYSFINEQLDPISHPPLILLLIHPIHPQLNNALVNLVQFLAKFWHWGAVQQSGNNAIQSRRRWKAQP